MVVKKKKKSEKSTSFAPQRQPRQDPLELYQQRVREAEELEKKRAKERMVTKVREEENKVDKLRLQMRKKYRSMVFEKPPAYVPLEPVTKSTKLREYEENISKGTFFDDDNTKKILEDVRNSSRKYKLMHALSAYDFGSTFGLGRAQ